MSWEFAIFIFGSLIVITVLLWQHAKNVRLRSLKEFEQSRQEFSQSLERERRDLEELRRLERRINDLENLEPSEHTPPLIHLNGLLLAEGNDYHPDDGYEGITFTFDIRRYDVIQVAWGNNARETYHVTEVPENRYFSLMERAPKPPQRSSEPPKTEEEPKSRWERLVQDEDLFEE